MAKRDTYSNTTEFCELVPFGGAVTVNSKSRSMPTAADRRRPVLPPLSLLSLISSLLPASTTTGLALTMPSGLPLIRAEWVAVGTAFNSATTQVRGSDGQTLPHTRMRVHSH